MLQIVNQIIPRAFAQFNGGGTNTPTSSFTLDSFNFLKPFVTDNNNVAKNTFGLYFSTIIGWFLTIASLAAFIYLLIAGFQYITAGGDSAKAETARKGIVNALIGIIVILVAYVVLRYVGTSILP